MKHTFTDSDLIELDRIWPLGQQLVVPENGTIVVAGAYEGRYLHYLAEMFPTVQLLGYEPQRQFTMNAAVGRLLPYMNRINISHAGLATAKRLVRVGNYGTDGCSVLATTGQRHTLPMLDVVEALGAGIGKFIDLLVLNCEGSEWALLPYMMDEMMHHNIRSMAIQFHPEYVSEVHKYRVLEYVSEYYKNTFQCHGCWTYWQRKES